jgi:glutathionyl-hydroquinone reductase
MPRSEPNEPKPEIFNFPTKNGAFQRPDSAFRSWISSEAGSQFPPEKDRYVLYINLGCPWASRTNLVRTLKGLEEIIQIVILDWELYAHGWSFTGRDGTAEKDPLYGFTRLSDLYFKANPDYKGRYTVPVLWDKKLGTIVSNESSEIIRMFYTEFDSLLPAELREVNKPNGGVLPAHLKEEIEEMNSWVYPNINNGVYRSGFATTQTAYEEAVTSLFAALDRVESHLENNPGPYLFGKHITEADIRLYPTIARFDIAYYGMFMCNLYMIREHYPRIQEWFERLFWDESEETRGAFRKSTNFNAVSYGLLGQYEDIDVDGDGYK